MYSKFHSLRYILATPPALISTYKYDQNNDVQLMETEDSIENNKDIFHQEVVSQVRETYNEEYEEEIQLNEEFNQFVTNYKAAYEGENTRKEQALGVRFSKATLAAKRKSALTLFNKYILHDHNNYYHYVYYIFTGHRKVFLDGGVGGLQFVLGILPFRVNTIKLLCNPLEKYQFTAASYNNKHLMMPCM